ncbi:hypothetical protein [Mucilaginibacter celer]|uniref:Uncharacterized protein n=1 Tax=Mucilaginibacter celer TaxID=2305508 RepID=A0A494VT56_9SPHI|nr:hypothetical protein [Mucilaginibacter celer]AYL94568.1 hypothetical protein HYN43_004305 [Mucilaginibacter celer]
MKSIVKRNQNLLPILILSLILQLLSSNSSEASTTKRFPTDSIAHSSKTREVLLSQQLFVVKLSKPKAKNARPGKVDLKAELRDAFMIVCYDKNKTYNELNWTMCPDGHCPVAGEYQFGSVKYRQLDTLIAKTKLAEAEAAKKTAALIKSVQNKTH